MIDESNELRDFWTKKAPEPVRTNQPSAPNVPVGLQKPGMLSQPPKKPNADAPASPNYTPGEVKEVAASSSTLTLDELLIQLLDSGSSDLHLTAGMPPMMRKHGEMMPIPNYSSLSSPKIQELVFAVMPEQKQAEFLKTHEMDFAHSIPGRSRFRVNVMQQRGKVGSVIRVIPNEIKSLEQLGMPIGLEDFSKLPRGLVLVTGPTGSGKSTTLAAIIDAANRKRKDHILTIEDPIEFVHENKGCIINQREIGADTSSFPEALKRALRQDPDIILVGEMRDPETISIAITAAETGHLVFGTLHTQSAAETMSRIIDSFPDGSKEQVRAQLAATIQGIVCQTLLKTIDGRGRVAAMEILKGEPAIRALIRKGNEAQIRSALETGKAKGMQTLDMSLMDLVKADKVHIDEAANRSTAPEQFYQQIGGESEVARIRRRQEALGGSATR